MPGLLVVEVLYPDQTQGTHLRFAVSYVPNHWETLLEKSVL
jgi:hypothetical protein